MVRMSKSANWPNASGEPEAESLAKQVVQWARPDETVVATGSRDASTLGGVEVLASQPPDVSGGEPPDAATRSEHAQQVLSAGIQDISNALVEDFSLTTYCASP